MDDQETALAPPRASLDWSTRRRLLSERWAKETPAGEYHGGTTKCGNWDLPTVWQQSSCCPLS